MATVSLQNDGSSCRVGEGVIWAGDALRDAESPVFGFFFLARPAATVYLVFISTAPVRETCAGTQQPPSKRIEQSQIKCTARAHLRLLQERTRRGERERGASDKSERHGYLEGLGRIRSSQPRQGVRMSIRPSVSTVSGLDGEENAASCFSFFSEPTQAVVNVPR